MAYMVTAPYVTATMVDEGGTESVIGFYAGAVLPANVKKESAELLVHKGMAEKVADAKASKDEKLAAEQETKSAEAKAKLAEDEKADAETKSVDDAKAAKAKATADVKAAETKAAEDKKAADAKAAEDAKTRKANG